MTVFKTRSRILMCVINLLNYIMYISSYPHFKICNFISENPKDFMANKRINPII